MSVSASLMVDGVCQEDSEWPGSGHGPPRAGKQDQEDTQRTAEFHGSPEETVPKKSSHQQGDHPATTEGPCLRPAALSSPGMWGRRDRSGPRRDGALTGLPGKPAHGLRTAGAEKGRPSRQGEGWLQPHRGRAEAHLPGLEGFQWVMEGETAQK